VVPRWVPLLGGKRIPMWAAVVPAALGAAALIYLSTQIAFNWGDPEPGDPDMNNYPSGVAGVVTVACYAPLLAWDPLLVIVTVSYCVRRRARRG
jgi:hypothetical protein